MERPSRKIKLVSTVCGVEKTEQTNLPSESVMHRNAQVERGDGSWTWMTLTRSVVSLVQIDGDRLTNLIIWMYRLSAFPTMWHPTWSKARNVFSFHVKAISKQNIERCLGNSPLIIIPFSGPMHFLCSDIAAVRRKIMNISAERISWEVKRYELEPFQS